MKKDYQTKKGRLTIKDYKINSKLVDNEIFGMPELKIGKSQIKTNIWEKIGLTIIILWVLFYIYQAINFIF